MVSDQILRYLFGPARSNGHCSIVPAAPMQQFNPSAVDFLELFLERTEGSLFLLN